MILRARRRVATLHGISDRSLEGGELADFFTREESDEFSLVHDGGGVDGGGLKCDEGAVERVGGRDDGELARHGRGDRGGEAARADGGEDRGPGEEADDEVAVEDGEFRLGGAGQEQGGFLD